MTPKKDSFTLVMLGAWNPSIFKESWILQNLLNDKVNPLHIAFPLDDPTAPRKITFEGVNLYPGRKQLLLSPEEPTLAGMRKCSSVLSKILKLLSHTPVAQFGINFTFSESTMMSKIIPIFNFSDRSDIDKKEFCLEESKVNRKFILSDKHILNLLLSYLDSRVEIGFNYHYELNDISKYLELLAGEYLSERYDMTLRFCKGYYDIDLEEGEDSDN